MDGTASTQLQHKIREIRETLREAEAADWRLNEADTERIVIDPLLHELGYSPLDIRKRGHDSIANSFPDYTLLPGKPQKWFLEVKKLDLPLQDGEAAQAVNYANNQGATWAVLTNGRIWYVYNAHLPKPLPEKRVFEISDLFGDENALTILARLSRASMLADGLREAWLRDQVQRIVRAQIETPHSATRKYLRKIVADEVQAPTTDALIAQALCSLVLLPDGAGSTETIPSSLASFPEPKPTGSEPPRRYTFAEIGKNAALGTGKKPGRLQFADVVSSEAGTWADAAAVTLAHIGRHFGLPPLPFSNRGKGKTYFLNTQPDHHTGRPMRSYRVVPVGGVTVYVDTNRSARDMAASLAAMLAAVNGPEDAVQVSLRSV